MADNQTLKIPILSETHFAVWKLKVQIVLKLKKLWKLVSVELNDHLAGKFQANENADPEARREGRTEALEFLTEPYLNNSRSTQRRKRRELKNIQLEEGGNMRKHLSMLANAFDDLDLMETGLNVDEKFDNIFNSSNDLTLQVVIRKLNDKFDRRESTTKKVQRSPGQQSSRGVNYDNYSGSERFYKNVSSYRSESENVGSGIGSYAGNRRNSNGSGSSAGNKVMSTITRVNHGASGSGLSTGAAKDDLREILLRNEDAGHGTDHNSDEDYLNDFIHELKNDKEFKNWKYDTGATSSMSSMMKPKEVNRLRIHKWHRKLKDLRKMKIWKQLEFEKCESDNSDYYLWIDMIDIKSPTMIFAEARGRANNHEENNSESVATLESFESTEEDGKLASANSPSVNENCSESEAGPSGTSGMLGTSGSSLSESIQEEQEEEEEKDNCLFITSQEDKIICLLVNVDDFEVAGNDKTFINLVMKHLSDNFEISNLGGVSQYLSIDTGRDTVGRFFISQSSDIDKILTESGQENAKVSQFSMDFEYLKREGIFLPDNKECIKLTGMLYYTMYIYVYLYRDVDLVEVLKIIKYWKRTRNLELKIANGGEEKLDHKSNSGNCIFMNVGLISWYFLKLGIVPLSAAKTELIALSEALKEVNWAISIKPWKPVKLAHHKESLDLFDAEFVGSRRSVENNIVRGMSRQYSCESGLDTDDREAD
jgi:hypothetical protein